MQYTRLTRKVYPMLSCINIKTNMGHSLGNCGRRDSKLVFWKPVYANHKDVHHSLLGGLKETKWFLPHPRVKVSIVGSLRDREVACSASDRQGLNFESCVWRTVSSQSSHHPQEFLLAQFSLYMHKGGLKPDSFHLHHPPSSLIMMYITSLFTHNDVHHLPLHS